MTAAIDALVYLRTPSCPFKADPGIKRGHDGKDQMYNI